MEEIWKDIKGYEGYYQVSNFGIVKSLDRYVKNVIHGEILLKGRIMPKKISSKGYLQGRLSKDGKRTNIPIHRLIAMHFIPNPENKPHVNHIDGDKTNNNISNLEWVTQRENVTHYFKSIGKRVYTGVSRIELSNSIKWEANFYFKGKQIYVGRFKFPRNAYIARLIKMEEYGIKSKY